MKRLMEKMVFSGLVTACRRASWPTRRSPDLVTATTLGVVRAPSAFSSTTGSPPSMTAMAQLNEVQEMIMAQGYPTILGNYDEGVGFDREDCGCHYVKLFDIAMSTISFLWTREHTTDEHKAWLRALPREIRFVAEGHRVLL